jgi:hypothetical protein
MASFNEDDIQDAITHLSNAERLSEELIASYSEGLVGKLFTTSKSIFGTVASYIPFGGSSSSQAPKAPQEEDEQLSNETLKLDNVAPKKDSPSYCNEYLRALNISAEANLLIGLLTFTQESVMAFVKGGLRLRTGKTFIISSMS